VIAPLLMTIPSSILLPKSLLTEDMKRRKREVLRAVGGGSVAAGEFGRPVISRAKVRRLSSQAKAPPPVRRLCSAVQRCVSFQRVREQKIFTVEESKATDFRDREAGLLEDVTHIFGKTESVTTDPHPKAASRKRQRAKHGLQPATCKMTWRAKRKPRRGTKMEASAQQKVHVEPRGPFFFFFCFFFVVLTAPCGLARNGPAGKSWFSQREWAAWDSDITPKKERCGAERDVRFFLAPLGNDIDGKKEIEWRCEKNPVQHEGSLDFARE